MTQDRSAGGNGRGSTRRGLPLSLGLYGLVAASLAGACLYFFLDYVPGRRAAAIKAWQQELVVRADLRKMTLDHWVAVGMADADILAVYPTPRALIAEGEGALIASRAADAAAHLREVAERFARMRGYHRFVLLDANLRIVVGVGAAAQLERPDLQAAAEVLAQGKTIVDFHRYADGRVAAVFLARVRADTASRTGGGVVLLEADPSKWLYPYLVLRPMAAASAETVLVQADGDDIVFLSPLRHNPAPPLTFRRPANVMGFAALAAVEGREGFGEYVDYRNEPVFAAVTRLDRAPWGIVVKVDRREALATYRQEIRQTGATTAFAFLGLWAAAFLQVRAWHRRAERRLETEHSLLRAMINRPDDVIVFSLDPDYCYTVFNEKHRLEMKKVWNVDIRVGMNLLDCMTAPELRRLAKLSIDRALRGEAFWEEQHQPNLDIYYEFSWNPILLGKKIVGVAVFIRDITERRRAEVVLRNSEAELRAVLNATPFPVALVDVDDNKIEFWSRSALTLFGHTAPTAAEWYQLAYPDPDYRREVIARWKPLLEKAHSSGETVNTGEYRVTCRDGSVRLCELYATFLPDKLIVTFNDITERKRAEEALRESQKALVEAQTVARVGSWEWDAVRDEIAGSQEFYRLFDVAPEELTRFSQFAGRLHPDDRERVEQDVAKALHLDRPYDTDYRVRLGNGTWRDINARGQVFTDLDGKAVRMAGTCLDVTERKQAEAALRESERRLRRFYESGLLGVIFWNMRGQITDANDKFLEMVGYTRAELNDGQIDWLNMTPPEFRHLDDASVAELKATGVNKTPLEKEYIRKDGTRIPIAVAGVMLDGERANGVAFVQDISERKQAEAEIRRLNAELEQRVRDRTAQLEQSNKELEAFSYSVSHDLRAPLRAIDGFTRLLADDYAPHLDTEGKRVCSVIHENTRKMSQLIDDLLAFSRLGRAEMSLSRTDMETMANSVFHELTTPESRARIDFQVGVLPPVVADPTLMRQVWMNLLSNAIKFSSKRDRAVIRVSAQQNQGESVYVVQDNGAGFDMQYVGKLFGVFQRLHNTREFEGTGVGLALVQRVIRRHGGRVWAEGETDKGATFYFALQQRGA